METQLEHILISSYKNEMISYMKTHEEAFDEAVALAISDKQPFSWRAAWLLWSCMEENDRRIKKHIKRIVHYIPLARDNQKRELLKILLCMQLNDKQSIFLFDKCMELWKDITKDPSVRYTALKMILKISDKYPELYNEFALTLQDHFIDTLSPGIKKSIARLIRGAQKN